MSDDGHAPVPVLDYSGPAVDWVTIAVFARSVEWFGACHRLIPYGIDCRIGRDNSPLHHNLLCNAEGGVSLQVRRDEAERALDILRALGECGQRHTPVAHFELGAELGSAWAGIGPRLVLAVSAVVHVDAEQFVELASKPPPLPVVVAPIGLLRRRLRYLASRNQMTFTVHSAKPLKFPDDVPLIPAKKIWVP